MNRQGVRLTVSYRQFYDLLHDAACNGGIVGRVDVLRLFVQIVIEVDADRCATVDGNFILQSPFVTVDNLFLLLILYYISRELKQLDYKDLK